MNFFVDRIAIGPRTVCIHLKFKSQLDAVVRSLTERVAIVLVALAVTATFKDMGRWKVEIDATRFLRGIYRAQSTNGFDTR